MLAGTGRFARVIAASLSCLAITTASAQDRWPVEVSIQDEDGNGIARAPFEFYMGETRALLETSRMGTLIFTVPREGADTVVAACVIGGRGSVQSMEEPSRSRLLDRMHEIRETHAIPRVVVSDETAWGETVHVQIQLQPKAEIAGQVVDDQGQPLECHIYAGTSNAMAMQVGPVESFVMGGVVAGRKETLVVLLPPGDEFALFVVPADRVSDGADIGRLVVHRPTRDVTITTALDLASVQPYDVDGSVIGSGYTLVSIDGSRVYSVPCDEHGKPMRYQDGSAPKVPCERFYVMPGEFSFGYSQLKLLERIRLGKAEGLAVVSCVEGRTTPERVSLRSVPPPTED
ncbi:MAG: hypothetical protein AAF297_07020 [Planctomycetota bacterium]